MIKYRITKYNPKFRDKNGVYLKDEWTSYDDIGQIRNYKEVTVEEYLNTEEKYIKAILSLLNEKKVNSLIISDLEKMASYCEIETELKMKGLFY